MFSDAQLRIVADISVSAGQVFLASLVVPFFIGQFSIVVFAIGVMFTGGAWIMALVIGKQIQL